MIKKNIQYIAQLNHIAFSISESYSVNQVAVVYPHQLDFQGHLLKVNIRKKLKTNSWLQVKTLH